MRPDTLMNAMEVTTAEPRVCLAIIVASVAAAVVWRNSKINQTNRSFPRQGFSTSHQCLKRRLSECSRRFHNHGEGPY